MVTGNLKSMSITLDAYQDLSHRAVTQSEYCVVIGPKRVHSKWSTSMVRVGCAVLYPFLWSQNG